MEEVDSQTVFETRDQLQVGITPNQNGYLYFILASAKGGLLRNDIIYVKENTEYVGPSVCPGVKKPRTGCFFTLAAPAPASGVEEIVIIFSRNKITNLPNNRREGVALIKPEILQEIKAKSGQTLKQIPGKIERLLHGASGRFATVVQNSNVDDNEELVYPLEIKHQR